MKSGKKPREVWVRYKEVIELIIKIKLNHGSTKKHWITKI